MDSDKKDFIQDAFSDLEVIEVNPGQVFKLNELDTFYWIEEGTLDIYFREYQSDESISGSIFVNSFEKGDLLMTIPSSITRNEIQVHVHPISKVKLRVIPKEKFHLEEMPKEAIDQITPRVKRWVERISTLILKELEKIPHTEVRQEDIVKLSKGESISLCHTIDSKKRHSLYWLKINKGAIIINGDDKSFYDQNSELFPVVNYFTLTAESDAEISFVLIDEVINRHAFAESFRSFHAMIIHNFLVEKERRINENTLQLQKNIALEKDLITDSTSVLGSVLSEDIIYRPTANADLILKACQILGSFSNIEFKAPHGLLDKGLTPEDHLKQVCQHSNVKCRKVRLDVDFWKYDNGPMLLYSGQKPYPLVLCPIKPTKYKLIDPKTGEIELLTEEVTKYLQNEAIVFYKAFPKEPFGYRLFKFALEKCSFDIITVILVSLASSLVSLFTPFAMTWIFDKAIPDQSYTYLYQVVGGMLAASIGSTLFSMTRSFAVLRLEGKSANKVQSAIWDRLLRLKLSFFRKYNVGDLFQRANAIDEMRRVVGGAMLSTLISSVFSVFYLIVMGLKSWKLTMIAITPLIFAVGVYSIGIYMTVKREYKVLNLQGKIYAFFVEIVSAIEKVRATRSQNRTYGKWSKLFAEKKDAEISILRIHNWLRVIHNFILGATTIIIYLTVMHFMKDPTKHKQILKVGEYLGFHSAFGAFSAAIFGVCGSFLTLMSQVLPRWWRAKEILKTEPEDSQGKESLEALNGGIEIHHVYFHYDPTQPMLLRDIDLVIKPGEFLAITGKSGCGKSTLIKLLLGFEEPLRGKIFYDGQDITKLHLSNLRRQMGIVLQHGAILSGTIKDNITCARNFTDDQIMETLEICGFAEDVQNLPMGLETVLPPGGGTLSEGQRQRIMIARALIAKPKILILDEATSALDNQTQDLIKSNIDKLNVTRIVIAHRLSTIQNADRILVLDNGEVVDSGTYEELTTRETGLFKDLVSKQILT